jgi:chemotaxis protein methyltransferase CheR
LRNSNGVDFLQWALPRLRMRWRGFRRVRGAVCKRIRRRMRELGLDDWPAYRGWLETNPAEWQVLDGLCRITVSRFYRDAAAFDCLGDIVLPELVARAVERGADELRCWSAGCASGEEPYTLAILWELRVRACAPTLRFRVVATDVDEWLLARARAATYLASSLRDLPEAWRDAAFDHDSARYRLLDRFRHAVELRREDLRVQAPAGPFDLVLCRNLVCTYFEPALQREVLQRIVERLEPGGALVVGGHETVPEGITSLHPWGEGRGVYQRDALAERQPVRVLAYAGAFGEEEPRAVALAQGELRVTEVLVRWREPDGCYFRVRTEDGDRRLLLRREPDLTWWLVDG